MQNVHGILLVIVSMAGFTVEDMFIKQLSQSLPVGQILIMLGCGSGAVFAALSGGRAVFARAAWQPLFVLRALAEATAAMAFVTALSLIDISVVAAVFQATPLFITMGAALFVLISVAAVAARDLITRRIDVAVSSFVVSFQGFAALVPAGIVLLMLADAGPQAVSPTSGAMILGAVVFGAASYYGIVQAMRIADAAVVTPFRYTRLLFSLVVGVIVFGERPDTMTLLGAGLVIGTGLYTFVREQRLARRKA